MVALDEYFDTDPAIKLNDPEGLSWVLQQEKIIKYHHLVTALVVLFNTHHMTKALASLKKEGFPIIKDDLKHLSPYHKFGINLLGNYQPDLKRNLEPIATTLDLGNE